MTSFELTPGVVVDRDQGEIYAMSPDGGIDAVDLGSGEVVRHSPNAAKPLAVSGSVLVGQTEPAGLGNELDIVAFDIHDPGARITRSRVELPSGVQASIQQGANRAFTAHAEPSEASATVSWEFVERPLQGIPSGPVEVQPGETTPPEIAGPDAPGIEEAENEFGDLIIAHGAVRVELADGAITPVEQPPPAALADATPLLPSAAAADLAPASRLPDQPEPQFLSADGTHVLISERIEKRPGLGEPVPMEGLRPRWPTPRRSSLTRSVRAVLRARLTDRVPGRTARAPRGRHAHRGTGADPRRGHDQRRDPLEPPGARHHRPRGAAVLSPRLLIMGLARL